MKNLIQKYYKKIDLLDLELLISHITKNPREFILAHPEYILTKNQITELKSQISKRIRGEPLAYLTGHKEFYGLDFLVDKNVLVPRPETELIINYQLSIINEDKLTVVDVGTGSGCIIITLAKLLNKNTKFFAIDISDKALVVARKNAKRHGVDKKIKFLQGNLLEPIINNPKLIINNCKLIIVANLPYLTPTQIKNSPSIQKEPRLALEAGRDGLKYYRELFKQIKMLSFKNYELRVPNCEINVLCEIDPNQTKKIISIIKKEFSITSESPTGDFDGTIKIEIKKDLAGLDRIVTLSFRNVAKRSEESLIHKKQHALE
jgi:release factor glutamine methyltransferase